MGRKRLKTPVKYCERCGVLLKRRPLASGYEEGLCFFNKRRFCSIKCANSTLAENRLKKPAKNEKSSRERASKMVPFQPCAICGKEGYTEVHHIDKNPMNNSADNLIRLCKSCHQKQHRTKPLCVVCGEPIKGHNLCNKHWQAWRKSIQRGWDTEYTKSIKDALEKAECKKNDDEDKEKRSDIDRWDKHHCLTGPND